MALAAHKFNIELGAALSGSFESSLDKGKEKLGALGAAVRNLDIQAKAANSFTKLKNETDLAKQSWQDAENQVQTLALEIQNAATPTAELSQRFQEAQLTAENAKQTFMEKQEALESLSLSIKKAGMDTEQLALKQTKLGASVEKLKAQYASMQVLMRKQSEYAMKARAAMGPLMRIGLTAAATFGLPIKKAIDAQEAMANLGKVTNIVRSQGIGKLRSELEGLTKTLPFTFQELTNLATMGARIGMKDADLKAWTEVAGKMATVFGMSTDEMGDSIAKLQGAFKLGLNDLESMGDVINYLGDVSMITSKDLIKSMADISGVANQFGLSVRTTAGLATTFVKIGYDATQSSAAINQVLLKLGTAADGTSKSATQAARNIGIVPETLKKMMKENPEQALIYALEKINAVPMEKQRAALLQIFGAKAQAHASKLADNVNVLKETFANLADQTKVAGVLQKDYGILMSTTKEQMKLFRNSFEQLGIAIGEAVLPTFTSMMQSVTGFFQKVTDFSKEHPKIFSFLTKGTALILGLAAGAAVLKLGFFGVSSAIAGLGAVFKGLALVASLNPVILAVTGLAVGATLVIKYWTQVKEFFANLWAWITEKFSAIGDFFGKIGSGVSGFFKKIFPFGNKEPEVSAKVESVEKPSFSDIQLSTPANKTAANTNKTQNNTFNFTISANQESRNIAEEISKAVQQSTRDALYDSPFYVG